MEGSVAHSFGTQYTSGNVSVAGIKIFGPLHGRRPAVTDPVPNCGDSVQVRVCKHFFTRCGFPLSLFYNYLFTRILHSDSQGFTPGLDGYQLSQ